MAFFLDLVLLVDLQVVLDLFEPERNYELPHFFLDLAHTVSEDELSVVAAAIPVEIDSIEHLDNWPLFVVLDRKASGNSLVKSPAVNFLDLLSVLADLSLVCCFELVLSQVDLVLYLLLLYVF